MKKEDLEVFDIVKLRDGKVLMVLPNDCSKDGFGLFSLDTAGCFAYFDSYNEDLEYICDSRVRNIITRRDIVAVYKSKGRGYTAIKQMFCENRKEFRWSWERKETKEMTLDEIEKELGYKVKIINGKEDL